MKQGMCDCGWSLGQTLMSWGTGTALVLMMWALLIGLVSIFLIEVVGIDIGEWLRKKWGPK